MGVVGITSDTCVMSTATTALWFGGVATVVPTTALYNTKHKDPKPHTHSLFTHVTSTFPVILIMWSHANLQ